MSSIVVVEPRRQTLGVSSHSICQLEVLSYLRTYRNRISQMKQIRSHLIIPRSRDTVLHVFFKTTSNFQIFQGTWSPKSLWVVAIAHTTMQNSLSSGVIGEAEAWRLLNIIHDFWSTEADINCRSSFLLRGSAGNCFPYPLWRNLLLKRHLFLPTVWQGSGPPFLKYVLGFGVAFFFHCTLLSSSSSTSLFRCSIS